MMPPTVVEHLTTADGCVRLTVRVEGCEPHQLAAIAGDALAELDPETSTPTGATLHTSIWDADVHPEAQREETRALIEQALSVSPAPEITPPGTEL